MKKSGLRIGVVAMLLPALACAAVTAQKELTDALRATPDAANGKALFDHCASCHGADGGGDSNGSTPRIAGQHFRVLAKQLVDFRSGKRWDFRMEGAAEQHHLAGAQDIADVAAHVSRLAPPGRPGIGSGDFVAEGGRIYAQECASCHGPAADGDAARGVPRLAGQHYGYLMRQMYDAVDGRRPALPRLHSKKIAPLDFQQVRALSDYLSRLDAGPVSAQRGD
jgi:cytochrome c553